MPHFTHLLPQDLTESEKLDLVKLAKWDYDHRSAAEIVLSGLEGRITFWRIEGEMRGLLLTRLLETKRGRTLYIEGQMAKGGVGDPGAVRDALFQMAQRAGCKWISGLVSRPGMLKILEEIDFPVVAQIFLREVPNAEA